MNIRSFFSYLDALTSPEAVGWLLTFFIIVLFIVNVFYIFSKRKKSFFLTGAIIVFESAFLVRAVGICLSVTDVICLIVLSVGADMAFSFLPKIKCVFRLIKKRTKRSVTVDFKSFIPVTEKDKVSDEIAKNSVDRVNPVTVYQSTQPNEEKDFLPETDYSHVKNIIEKLSYYNLNGQEKKSVNDLKIQVARVENGDNSPLLKERISEGLGVLLKIMAKYNV